MSTERLIASHLRLAAEALAASKLLTASGNRNAAYMAEQAVEQILLALAQAEKTTFARSQHHQLETMRRALPDVDAFRDGLAELTWLEAYATTCRYFRTMGGLGEPPNREQLSEALDTVGTLLRLLADHFQVDLGIEVKSPAAHARPPRAP